MTDTRDPATANTADASDFGPPPAPPDRAWVVTLRSNWMLPLAIAALIPLQMLLTDRDYVDRYTLRIIMLIGINVILAVSLQLINGISGQFSLGHAGFMAVGAYLAGFPARQYSAEFSDPAAVLGYYLALLVATAAGAAVFWGVSFAVRKTARLHPALPLATLGAFVVWLLADLAIAARHTAPLPPYLLWSHAAELPPLLFDRLRDFLIPAGTSVSSVLPGFLRFPLCFLILLAGGGLCAAVAGLVVGLPTLRLRGDYLAIATLGFAEIIRIVIINSKPAGGALGLLDVPTATTFTWLYGTVIVTTVVIWRVAHSSTGRAFKAVREDEVAAAATGIDTTQYKVLAFVIGAFFAGVAGALAIHFEGSVYPNSFGFMRSVELVVIVVVAGRGSITGTVLAAAVLTWLPEQLRGFQEWRLVIYAAVLIALMLLRPDGILGTRELWPRRRRRVAGATAAAA